MTSLFEQIATEDDKKYLKAYHASKEAIEAIKKLNTNQRRQLFNELSIERFVKQLYNR